jgi:hypothetical protein
MAIHFVTIKVSIVGVTIGIVHAQGLFFDVLEDSSFVCHDTRFVEGGLTIDEEDIATDEVSIHFDPRIR